MAIKFEKTQVKGGFPVFWRGEREVLPGDFAFRFRGRNYVFPVATTIIFSLLLWLLSRLI